MFSYDTACRSLHSLSLVLLGSRQSSCDRSVHSQSFHASTFASSSLAPDPELSTGVTAFAAAFRARLGAAFALFFKRFAFVFR